jgi:hypothetical protein
VGGAGFILVTKMTAKDYDSLYKRDFTTPMWAAQYGKYVNDNRRTGGRTASPRYDIEIGPVAFNASGQWVANPRFPNQYALKPKAIAKLKVAFIVPTWHFNVQKA